ncbi:YqaA family protein [Methylogaea oryzae]|uniref:YqaA family protein n=1 Tax=Methylogaea oryzae TaxID=1295382 RepID=UPI000B0E87FB|nr:hypothetical protein [Methylogaea oryzae]
MDDVSSALGGLFASAFISATLAPGGSEAVLAYLATQAAYSDTLLLGVATTGNTLGAVTTWLMGYAAALGWLRRHAPPKQATLARMERYGTPLLLLSCCRWWATASASRPAGRVCPFCLAWPPWPPAKRRAMLPYSG